MYSYENRENIVVTFRS